MKFALGVEHLEVEASDGDVMERRIAQLNLPANVAEHLCVFSGNVVVSSSSVVCRNSSGDSLLTSSKKLGFVLVTALGSRHGCTIVPMIFNLEYAVATREAKVAVAPLGITLHLPISHVAIPWTHDVILEESARVRNVAIHRMRRAGSLMTKSFHSARASRRGTTVPKRVANIACFPTYVFQYTRHNKASF